MARETRNLGQSNTEIYGPVRDATHPISTRFHWNWLVDIISIVKTKIELNKIVDEAADVASF